MQLYKINEQLERLLMLEDGNAVDTETGEVFSPEQVNKLMMSFDEKVEGCLLFAKNQLAEAEAIKAEAKVLSERAKECENRSKRAKDYVASMLQGEKFETARVAVSYRSSTSCNVTVDVDKLPAEFQKISIEPKKAELTKFLKNGGKIDGVELITKQNMVLK